MSLWTGGILWCFTEKLQSFVHSQHSVPPIIQAKTKDAKPLMHKSTHSRQKDYVYHSIRDATLSGIMRSETPVSAGRCLCVLARCESNKSSTTTATPAGGHELSALFSV